MEKADIYAGIDMLLMRRITDADRPMERIYLAADPSIRGEWVKIVRLGQQSIIVKNSYSEYLKIIDQRLEHLRREGKIQRLGRDEWVTAGV